MRGIDLDRVQGPVRRELAQVDRQLARLFRSRIGIVNQVAGHFLATRGKKFRPTLLLLVARLDGAADRDDVVAATVVELIHAAALIHDDSVDSSMLRRGLPTVNRIWNDNVAIVVGDFLYSKAFETLVRERQMPAMEVLANVTHHMAIGEALELELEGDLALSERDYLQVIGAKTASLMAGACELGALDGGSAAATSRARRFRAFGEAVGIAFQIADDVMDFLGVPSETGKRPGTDLREGKVTLPLLHALRSLPKRRRQRLSALARRRRLPRAEYAELVALIHEGDGFEYSWRRAHALAKRAKSYLEDEPASPVRDSLSLAVDYAVQRTR